MNNVKAKFCYARVTAFFLIAVTLAFSNALASNNLRVRVVVERDRSGLYYDLCFPDDSITVDTVMLNPYYDFIQYYDSSRVVMRFGEVFCHHQSGGVSNHNLFNHDANNNIPLYNNSLVDLTALSGSLPFENISGDTINYFWMLWEAPEYFSESDTINVQDTLVYFLDVVSYPNGTILHTIDSLGVLPHINRWEMLKSVICSNDTGVIKQFVIPYYTDTSTAIRLQIRPVFKGDHNRLSVSRWDFLTKEKASSYEIYRRTLWVQNFYNILDSLYAIDTLLKRSHEAQFKVTDNYLSIVPNTVVSNVDAVLLARAHIGSNVMIKIYDCRGAVVNIYSFYQKTAEERVTIGSSRMPSGMYYAIMLIGNQIQAMRQFAITK